MCERNTTSWQTYNWTQDRLTDRQTLSIYWLRLQSLAKNYLRLTQEINRADMPVFLLQNVTIYQDWRTSLRSLVQKLKESDTVWIKECHFPTECISLCFYTILFLFVRLSYVVHSLCVIRHELQIFWWWGRKKWRQENKDGPILLTWVHTTSRYSKHPQRMDGTHPTIPRPH